MIDESNVVVYDNSTFGHQTHYNSQINSKTVKKRDDYQRKSRNGDLENGSSLLGLFGDDHQDALLSKLAIGKYKSMAHSNLASNSVSTMIGNGSKIPAGFSSIIGNRELSMKQKRLRSSPNLDLLLHCSQSDIERNLKHRMGKSLLLHRVKNVGHKYCTIGAKCYLYLFYDHLWFDANIVGIDISRNTCSLALKNAHHKKNGCVEVDPMQDILLIYVPNSKNGTRDLAINGKIGQMDEKQCDCCCPPALANEVSNALQKLNHISNWRQMGKLPTNFINSLVSMHATEYEQSQENMGMIKKVKRLKVNGANVVLAKSKEKDIGLMAKGENGSLLQSNSECEWVADMLIQSPVRQTAYQGNDASTVVYHIMNVIETERMTVKYFMQLANEEWKKEIRELRGMKDIYKYIENNEIEEHLEEIEREHLRNLPYTHPLYGADSLGSLFHSQQTWNLAHLSTILDLIDIEIHGMFVCLFLFCFQNLLNFIYLRCYSSISLFWKLAIFVCMAY